MERKSKNDGLSSFAKVAAPRRVKNVVGHLARNDGNCSSSFVRHSPVKWNGWGHEDTRFVLNGNGDVELTGKRYGDAFPGNSRVFPALRPWVERVVGIDLSNSSPPFADPPELPGPVTCETFVQDMKSLGIQFSVEDRCRLGHSHGHSKFKRTKTLSPERFVCQATG